MGPKARILVLDNHDDFGGHAKRNEFVHEGRTFIGYGGTQSIDGPGSFSAEAIGLLEELGVDVARFEKAFDRELYSSLELSRSVFFDKETFGEDRLVPQPRGLETGAFAAKTPLSPEAQKDLVRLYEEENDYMPGLSEDEKKMKLTKTSYLAFLEHHVKVHSEVVKYLYTRPHGLFAMGIDGVAALDCWGLGYPGFQGMGLTKGDFPGLSETAKPRKREPYIFHFPDGNASIARLLVRSLVPRSAPGNSRTPEEPIVLHLTKTPCSPGGSSRDQHAAGRYELLSTSFEAFERNTRDQLGRILAGGGFDPARDILGMTVNRWPHGYAYKYNSLWDPLFPKGQAPCEIARKPFGRIHIANSDAQAYAYTDAAIDQAYRAVMEITT